MDTKSIHIYSCNIIHNYVVIVLLGFSKVLDNLHFGLPLGVYQTYSPFCF